MSDVSEVAAATIATARGRCKLAVSFINQGDYNAALPLLESAVKELGGALGEDHQATAVAQRELARTLLELDEIERARKVATSALSILDTTAGPLSDASLITVACLIRLEANPKVGGGARLQNLLKRAKSAIANSKQRGGAVGHLAEEVGTATEITHCRTAQWQP